MMFINNFNFGDRLRNEIKNALCNGKYDYILNKHTDSNNALVCDDDLFKELLQAIQKDNSVKDKELLNLALCDVLELIMI